jgi:hypothetical protein
MDREVAESLAQGLLQNGIQACAHLGKHEGKKDWAVKITTVSLTKKVGKRWVWCRTEIYKYIYVPKAVVSHAMAFEHKRCWDSFRKGG